MVRLPYTSAIVLIVLLSTACLAESEEYRLVTPTDTPASSQIVEVKVTPTPGPWLCLKGKLQISDEAGGQWIIGEKLLCAPEWKISNLYGPNLDDHKGPIYFSDFIPQE